VRAREKILVVEDDRALREGLTLNLELAGFRVSGAADGVDGMRMAFDERPDLIVLDVMLPGWSGLDILAEVRARGVDVPVLILSARGTTDNKVEGLKIGADDYLAKPFELAELLARVEAMLRRRRMAGSAEPPIAFGDAVIDRQQRLVTVGGVEVALSAKEFDLLLMLAETPGRPRTRTEILDRVWGWGFEGSARTVDNFILSLRQKLEADPANPRHILTVRQVGYKLECPARSPHQR
jgi:two-component system alkaline phosphatase synthesis response regulator PhoP